MSNAPNTPRYPAYKPTNIPWCPEIPEGWEVRRLKYVALIDPSCEVSGIAPNDEVSFAPMECVRWDKRIAKVASFARDNGSYSSFNEGDIALAKVTPCFENGNLCVMQGLVNGYCFGSSELFCIRPQAVHSRYLLYFLQTPCFVNGGKASMTGTGGLKRVSPGYVRNAPIFLPPLPTQRAIVAYLDEKCGKIDRLVAAKEREGALLRELKQAVIAEAVTRGIRPHRLRPANIPWLPQIPEDWEVKRLVSLFSNEVKPNRDFAYTKAMKFNYGTLVPKNEIGEPEDYREVYVKYSILQEDDIVINGLNLNYHFNSFRVASSPCAGIITSAYIVCRPREGVASAYFAYLFKAMDYRKMFHGMGTGIRLTLSFNELRGQVLPVPPPAEQGEIVAYLEARCGKIDAVVAGLEASVAALKAYKQRLIADVVTGQRKVV